MPHREKIDEDYEFYVEKEKGYEENEGKWGYSVSLPHQCENWEILGADVAEEQNIENNGSYPCLPVSKEVAVKQMELFIKRAQEALEKLKALD